MLSSDGTGIHEDLKTILTCDGNRRGTPERLAAYLCQLALLLVGLALAGTPGISHGRQAEEPEAFGQRPVSLLLVDRHDDQRFAQPIDKRGQKNWRGAQSDPFLPVEISDLHPAGRLAIRAENRPRLVLSSTFNGFLARAPPHLTL